MRKTILLIFFLTISLASIFGESRFTFEHQDSSAIGLGEFFQFEGFIINISTDTLQLTTNRINLTEPPLDWSCSMCIVFCLPPFIDTYDFTLNPGDSAWFSLDVYPFEITGTGVWSIVVIDSSTMEADTAEYSVTYGTQSVKHELPTPQNFELMNIYPNPTNASFTVTFDQLNPGEYDLKLFDVAGHLVEQRSFQATRSARQSLNWDADALSSGNYLLQIQRGALAWSRQLTIVK